MLSGRKGVQLQTERIRSCCFLSSFSFHALSGFVLGLCLYFFDGFLAFLLFMHFEGWSMLVFLKKI